MSYPLIIGTAGHIDHGKSVLVQAITGQDPDRLPEEKQRGMTIDLGFAFWGEDVAFIDVPGHERLIRNMVAGASGIDLFLLVVAADEGVKPQTIEHLQILQILGIKEGVMALTKMDLVDGEAIERRRVEVERLLQGSPLEGSPIHPVSALTGQGLEELKGALRELLETHEKVEEGEIFRLPVDRSFSIKGFGTVVTGTVISGRIGVGEEVELLPAKRPLRIRGIEVMGKPCPEVRRGMRAALNLRGIGKEEIRRGDSLATPSFFQPTKRLEGELSLLKDFPGEVKGGSWLKFLTGTAEVMGRVYPLEGRPMRGGQSGLVRFNLEANLTGALGDRFVVRIPSPASTIGGGEILDPYPPTKRRGERLDYLHALKRRKVPQVIGDRLLRRGFRGTTENELWQATQLPRKLIRVGLTELEGDGSLVRLGEAPRYFLTSSLLKLQERIIDGVKGFHRQNPYRLGVGEDELGNRLRAHRELYRKALQELLRSGELSLHSGRKLALPSHHIPLSPQDEKLKGEIEETFLKGGFSPPSPRELKGEDARRLMEVLQERGLLVPTGDSLLFHQKWVKRAEELLREFLQRKGEISLREFKELLGTSRRYALSLLTYFDNQGITRRVGEVRRLK